MSPRGSRRVCSVGRNVITGVDIAWIRRGLDLEKDNYDSSVVNKNGYTSKSYYNLWINYIYSTD